MIKDQLLIFIMETLLLMVLLKSLHSLKLKQNMSHYGDRIPETLMIKDQPLISIMVMHLPTVSPRSQHLRKLKQNMNLYGDKILETLTIKDQPLTSTMVMLPLMVLLKNQPSEICKK